MRKLVITMGIFIYSMVFNVARADLPPQLWHCTSQAKCFAVLSSPDVIVIREGEEKGRISDMGTGQGFLAASEGVIIVTRSNSTQVYIHDLLNEETCSVDVGETCRPGVTFEVEGVRYAHVTCPDSSMIRRIRVDCSVTAIIPSNGHGPRNIIRNHDTIFATHNSTGTIGRLIPPAPSMMGYTTGFAELDSIAYLSDTDLLYINQGGEIYSKSLPLENGNATFVYSFPFNVSDLSGSLNYLVASGVGFDGYITDINDPTNYVTTDIAGPRTNAISPNNAEDAMRIYFIEGGHIAGVRLRAFDETGLEADFSPLMVPAYDIDHLAPILPPVCGNALLEPGETCDGTDFNGATCEDHGFGGGELECSMDCSTIFTGNCWYCGDGVMNPGEECDGDDLGDATCQDFGYESGELSCTDECTIDYGQCYTCGNGIIEGAEECEGADLDGQSCISLGFVGGTLSCGEDCMFDTSQCHMCGNGIADEGELCDGTDTPGMICQTLGLGYTGGTLACNPTCDAYDDSDCWTCGDGIVNDNEECDGENLNDMTCELLGLGNGTLSCFSNCTFNVSQCELAPEEYCGNGVVDPGEDCDDGDRSNTNDPAPGETLRCSENCKFIPVTCGVGGIDPGEECDGDDLGGETCESLGYQTGVLYCGEDCRFRTEDCSFESGADSISLRLNVDPEPGEFDQILQGEFEKLKSTLSPLCLSQDVGGDLVISTEPGSYCAVRATSMEHGIEKRVLDIMFMPENALNNEPPILRIYSHGGIAQNYGGHLSAYQGLDIATAIVQDRVYQVPQTTFSSIGVKFVRINPETAAVGNWIGFKGKLDRFAYCDAEHEECGFIEGEHGQWNYINIDRFFESLIDTYDKPKSKSGCNISKSEESHHLFLMFIVIFALMFLYLRRRKNL